MVEFFTIRLSITLGGFSPIRSIIIFYGVNDSDNMSDFTEISNETKTPKWNDGEIHNFLKMVSRTSAGIRRSIHDSYFCGEITDLL